MSPSDDRGKLRGDTENQAPRSHLADSMDWYAPP